MRAASPNYHRALRTYPVRSIGRQWGCSAHQLPVILNLEERKCLCSEEALTKKDSLLGLLFCTHDLDQSLRCTADKILLVFSACNFPMLFTERVGKDRLPFEFTIFYRIRKYQTSTTHRLRKIRHSDWRCGLRPAIVTIQSFH